MPLVAGKSVVSEAVSPPGAKADFIPRTTPLASDGWQANWLQAKVIASNRLQRQQK